MFEPFSVLPDEDVNEDTEINHPEYLKDLAGHQVDILNGYTGEIVKSFECKGATSPREYNFTTDNTDLDIEFNSVKLLQYIKSNLDEFEQYLKDNFTSVSGFWSYVENNYRDFLKQLRSGDHYDTGRNWAIMLGWYMRREVLTEEEYLNEMYEGLTEIVYNNTTNLAPEVWER